MNQLHLQDLHKDIKRVSFNRTFSIPNFSVYLTPSGPKVVGILRFYCIVQTFPIKNLYPIIYVTWKGYLVQLKHMIIKSLDVNLIIGWLR